MIKYHVFYAELMCLCELISRLNSKVSWILSYVENFFNIICDFLIMGGGHFLCIFYMVKNWATYQKIERKFFRRLL